MKQIRIIYWTTTIFFSGLFMVTGFMYITHTQVMEAKLQELHYPLYLLNIIGAGKILGAITLVQPRFQRLKELAYAGFFFDFLGAFCSHYIVQGFRHSVFLFIPLLLLAFFGEGIAQAATNKSVIIEFLVENVDNDYERIKDLTHDIVQKPTTMPWGNRSLLFRDPDGNLINFFTPVSPEAIKKFA